MNKGDIIGERRDDGAAFFVLALAAAFLAGCLFSAAALSAPSGEEVAAICRGGM